MQFSSEKCINFVKRLKVFNAFIRGEDIIFGDKFKHVLLIF